MSIEVKIPEIGESISEVTLGSWLIEDGEHVDEGDILCEVESDKATVELPAEASGILTIKSEAGSDHKIGDIIASIDPSGEPSKKEKPKDSEDKKEKSEDTNNSDNVSTKVSSDEKTTETSISHASPAARKILDESGVKSQDVKGTGKDGRITKEDAIEASKNKENEESKQEKSSSSSSSSSSSASHGEQSNRHKNTEKMTRLRRTISKRLVEAKNSTAMLTTFNEVDMTEILSLRKKYKEKFKEKYDVNLGFMSFFTKACCLALKEVPSVNAQINGDEIIYHNYADIGVAVSTEKGLVVPVVRNAEGLSFFEIEKEIIDLAKKARDGKLSIDEMQGGTFTITNGGIFGSMLSTPIINIPQSAILGMHNIVERPTAVNGEVVIRPIMYLALSYDHRIIDGRESVTFLYKVKEMLEDPARLLLEI